MPTDFPDALDDFTSPSPNSPRDNPSLAEAQTDQNDAIEAVEAKLGISASTPTAGVFLIGSGSGASAWGNTATASNPTHVPLMLKGASSQTADILRVLRNDGAVRLQVKAANVEGGLLHVTDVVLNKPTTTHRALLRAQATAKGIAADASQLRTMGLMVTVSDHADVHNATITGAANNGSGLVRLTSVDHGFDTGDSIGVYGVGGVTAANGQWLITVINDDTFDLVGSTFAGSYTSGGTATNRPMLNGVAIQIGTSVARDAAALAGTTAANGDDVGGLTIHNVGTAKATGAIYVALSPTVSGSAWDVAFQSDADTEYGIILSGDVAHDHIRLSGASEYGLNIVTAPSGAAIVLPNNSAVTGRTAAGVITNLFRFNTDDRLQISAPIRIPNDVSFFGRNVTNSADVALFKIDTTNRLNIKATTIIDDGLNVQFGTGTGTILGSTSSQKLGFWGTAPVAQPTTAIASASHASGAGTTVTTTDTFDGYSLSQVVRALRSMGVLT